jgi:hypothetical protein
VTAGAVARSLAVQSAMLVAIAFASGRGLVEAQETVTIQVPAFVDFAVTDISASTPGGPSAWRISFSNASLTTGKAVRFSVQADAASFTPPNGPAIPASKVSWSPAGASGGIAWSGALSSNAYTLVFQSDPLPSSGHVDLAWTLGAPGSGIRAGQHQLTVRWKVESITP